MEEPQAQAKMTKWQRFWAGAWPFLVVAAFGLMITVGIWGRMGEVLTGDDYAFHVARLQSSSKAWSNGQILPQVDPDALGGFGYAYNIFYGPLITYVAAILQFFLGAWPVVINLILVLAILLAGLMMCRVMRRISRSKALAVMVAVIYMASPYLLNNLYTRMALGEVVAFVTAPTLLLGLFELVAHERTAVRHIALAAALLVLAHSLSALLLALMAAIFVLVNAKKILGWDNVWRMLLGVVTALGLTAFFTIPLMEAKMTGIYGIFDQGYSEVYFGANPESMNNHRLETWQLFAANTVSENDLSGEKNLALGAMALIGLIGFLVVRRKIADENQRNFATGLYIAAVIGIIVAVKLIDWQRAPGILWQMQFPWRSLMVTAVCLSVVTGYVFYVVVRDLAEERQNATAIIVAMAAVYLVAPVYALKPSRHLADFDHLKIDPVVLGWEAEYAPMKLLCSPDRAEDVQQGFSCSLARVSQKLGERGTGAQVLDGKAEIQDFAKDGLKVSFAVKNVSENGAVIELPLIYYPGYEAQLDGASLPVTYSDEYNLVTVKVPAGAQGEVRVRYGLSRAARVGLVISGVTMAIGVIWLSVGRFFGRKEQKKAVEMAELMDSVREEMEKSEALTSKLNSKKGKKK